MKVALYARVSTTDKGQKPEMQLRPMREYCERMGWDWEEFIDEISGTAVKRPELDRLLKMLQRRHFDALMVWKLDRLARSVKQLIDLVYGELHPRNIDLICLTQNIDTTSSTGKLLFHVLGALAEFEHDLISERVTSGMALAKSRGIVIGRPRVLGDTPKQTATLQRLLDAYGSGQSIRQSAREAGLSPGTAYGYLKEAGVLKK